MGISDAFGGGGDELRDQLIGQNQPDDGQPYSADPIVLTDRLARKMAKRGREPQPELDFGPPPEDKAPDLSKFGKPVESVAAEPTSDEDLSKFGKPVETPAATPPAGGMTVAREAKALAKGIPHGAIAGAGGVLKGAAALHNDAQPYLQSLEYDPYGNIIGQNPVAPTPPLAEHPLHKAGQATQDFAQRLAPMSEQEKDSIGGRVGMGAGNLALYGAAALAAGPLAGLGAAAGGMALDTYGSVYEASKAAGKTDQEAGATAGKSALVAGVLGALPLGAGKLVDGLIAKAAVSAGAFTTLGEAQEWILQEIAKDYDPKAGYSLDQKRIIASLILGAGVGGLHHAFERDPNQPQQPGQQPPGPQPVPPSGQMPPPGPQPGPNPNSSNGPGSGPNAGSGPRPGTGPNPGQGPNTGGPSGTGGPGQQKQQPGTPPPGSGAGKASDPGYTMDPATRAKMERVYRHFEQGKDPSGLTDGELFDAVNESLRDTSSTGYKAKPETAEEKAAREETAADRHERDTLIQKGWDPAWVRAMTPEQRSKAFQSAMGSQASPKGGDNEPAKNARNAEARGAPPAGVRGVEGDQKPLQQSEGPGVQELRGARNQDRPDLGSGFSGVPDRNRPEASAEPNAGTDRQQQELRTGQRPVGDANGTGEQPAQERQSVGERSDANTGNVGAGNRNDSGFALDTDISARDVSGRGDIDAETRNIGDGTRAAPIKGATAADIARAQPKEPVSPAQAEAENYKHAHLELDHLGLTGKNSISVETGSGQIRKGKHADGTDWENKMPEGVLYGRIKGTQAADFKPDGKTRQSLDIFVGPDPTSPHVFVVDQHKPGGRGEFDEHKILAGFRGPDAALRAYADSYGDKGGDRIGNVVAFTPNEFKQWLAGDTTKALKKSADSGVITPREPASQGQDQARPESGGQTPAASGAAPVQTSSAAVRSKRSPGGTGSPQSLLQFLAGRGGLKPHPELEVMDGHKHLVDTGSFPPKRKLVKDDGMDLDTAREAAEEAGYFRGTEDGTSTIAEFLDAIDDEIRGNKRYSEGEEGTVTKRERVADEERTAHENAQADEILAEIEASGHGQLGPELKAKVLRLMATENLDPDSAVDRAIAELDREEDALTAAEFDDTYGSGAYDEILSTFSPESRVDDQPESGGRDRSEEGPPAEPRADSPRAREADGADEGNDAGRQGPGSREPDAGREAGDQAVARSTEDTSASERSSVAVKAEQPKLPKGKPARSESAHDRVGPNANFLRNATESSAFRKGGLYGLDTPLQREVLASVFSAAQDLQVLKAVIESVPVDVMDVLTRGKLSAEKLFHNEAVFTDLLSVNGANPVAVGIDAASALVSAVARASAVGLPLSDIARKSENGGTAAGAGNGDHAYTIEQTEQGAQQIIPGAEKAADKTMAQRAADAPLKPKRAQKAADDGLFGDGHKQTDLLDMVAKKPEPAKDPFDDIFDQAIEAEFGPKPALDIDTVADGLKKLFGKGLAEAEITFDDAKYQAALPFFKAGVQHFAAGGADLTTMVRSLVRHLSVAGMDADAIRAMKPYIKRFTDDVTAGRETIDAPSSSKVLERDRGEPASDNAVGGSNVQPAAGRARRSAGGRGEAADAGDERSSAGERLPQTYAPVVGEEGNFELPPRESEPADSDAADRDEGRGDENREGGFSFDDTPNDEAVRNAQQQADLKGRREAQQKADARKIPWKEVSPSNIAESLPMLFPEQQADVLAAEQRFAKTEGHGMLFTNGTGTGKTYSGLGVIKRFFQKGTPRTLVVAPSQGILMDWQKSAKDLGLEMHVLDSTVDKGRGGLNGTTYANLGENPTLADGEWALVVADEAHKLSSDKDGTTTKALSTFRALTLHPEGLHQRARMVLRKDWEAIPPAPKDDRAADPDREKRQRLYAEFEKKAAPLIAKWKDEQRPKALMMSATPFAYHFSLDYAEGYLFDYDRSEDTKGGYNRGDGRDKFYMQHLGYRMRTNKLTKPDADVQSEVMERQLHEYLKSTGSLAGRALTVDKDYDRKFMLVHEAIGQQIDQGLQFLQDNEEFRPLHDFVAKKFDYLTRMRLLEAIKARAAVPIIKKNLALGRKVVVFHDYNEGGGINPFDLTFSDDAKTARYKDGKHEDVELKPLYEEFIRQNPYVKELKFASYLPPIAELTKAFPDAMVYNGTVPVKKRNAYKAMFNDDASGKDLIIVQSAAGEAGISLHDTTGKHQRVLINLGMPIRPTTSIQQEGRIYRVGQASDALFRYMSTGTDWERWTFAGKIAERAGTAENLALGNLARTIRQSFIDAFSNADDYPPQRGEGKGGKDIDRATSESISEFTKAKTHYFANAKTTGKRDQREGIDYYPTPEPVGLKMVEFANVKPGEKILEPSAGHGAIARYFPETTARTLVEPSSSLASRAALTSPGARVVVDRFENLDTAANKFDAIVMNPPFGTGGKTAMEHVAKAAKHLKNGGRIVALIPRGATADKRFEDFMSSPAANGIYLVGDIALPAVTFERAGTAINAQIVVLEKQTDPEIRNKLQQKSRDYSSEESIKDLFDRIEHADMGERLQPKTPDIDIPTEGNVTVNDVQFKLSNSKDKTIYEAAFKGFAGPAKFRNMMRAVEATNGEYVKSQKAFRFKTEGERQAFLDHFANPPVDAEAKPAATGTAPTGVTFTTGETTHAKTGEKLFVATANERVASEVYAQMNAAAKANGGYYSSFRGRGAIPGFQFKSEVQRKDFLRAMGFASPETDEIMRRIVGNALRPTPSPVGHIGQTQVILRGRETGTEHLVAYDAKGDVVFENQGSDRFVGLSDDFVKAIADQRNSIVVHHNHPRGSSFSLEDIRMLGAPGLHAVWAHGNNGEVYRASLTPEFRKIMLEEPSATAAYGGLQMMYKAAENAAFRPINAYVSANAAKVLTGQIDTAVLASHTLHLVNQTLADAGIIDYRSNYDVGDFVSQISGLNDALRTVKEAIRKGAFGDQAAAHDASKRGAQSLRHVGDLGAIFDRAKLAAGLAVEESQSRPHPGSDRGNEGPVGFAAPQNSFDKTVGDILRTRLLGRLGELNATEARVQLQDKFIRIKKAEDSVGAPSDLSAYQAESLYYGRTGQRLEALTENHIDPIIREMKARDIDLDSFDDFLYARHAPERNQKLADGYTPGHDFYEARTNPDIVGASGWSTNHALGVIRAIRQRGKLQEYLAVARMIDALNARTRRTLYDAGLIDRATLDAWSNAYKYYVPLRGWAEGSDHGESISKQGSGLNIRGKEAKTAFGRKSEAASPTAYSIMQAELAIVRAEKNKVGNTMYDFVRANPDPTRWTINRREPTKRFDPNTGLVTTIPNNMPMLRDNEFVTKRNGKEVVIQFNGPDGLNLARALKNMGTANVHKLIRAYAQVTHTMAKLATAWNPEFMIPNLIRDAGEAFINLTPQQQRGFVRNFAKHLPGAMVGSSRAIAGKGAGDPYVEAFKRYDEAGGRIRFFGIEDPDAIEQNVSRKLARLQGGPLNTLKDIGDKAAKALEIAGGGIENATRLAAFMAAEDAGFTQADAAMLARNLTVDFNKKGELGGAIGSLYMFANAGIQGQARMLRSMGHRQVWAAIGALAGAAALSTLYSIWASNVDETGVPDYMKIPSWERDRNLIFMFGDNGRYMKLPLPYGFSMFAVAASRAVSVMLGHEKPGKAAHAVMDSVINAFNPLGEESTTLMDAVPSALRPAFHIAFNRNWTGKPLYPEPDKNRGQMPDSTQFYRTNSAFSKEAAKQMNAWSGGSPYKAGAVDVHPGSIDHALQAIGGGVGRFAKGMVDSFYHNAIEGGEWQPEKTPILRRFTGKVGEEADRAFYYEQRQEALDKNAAINRAKKDLKNPELRQSAQELLRESSTDNTRTAIFKSADEQMKKLRQQEEQIRNSDQSDQAKKDALTILRSNMRKIQNEARSKVKRLELVN